MKHFYPALFMAIVCLLTMFPIRNAISVVRGNGVLQNPATAHQRPDSRNLLEIRARYNEETSLTAPERTYARAEVEEIEESAAQKRLPLQRVKPATADDPAAPIPTASITISCGNGKKLVLSTGNDAGSCTLTTDGPNGTGNTTGGQCQSGLNAGAAFANCSQGCTQTTGTGSCSTTY